MEVNEFAFCGGSLHDVTLNPAYPDQDTVLLDVCPYYKHVTDADYMIGKDGKKQLNAKAWGHCQRFPKWEYKNPTTPACGEHPQFFETE